MPSLRPNLLVLRSPNLEAARQFYESLGLSFTSHTHGQGPLHYAHESLSFVFELYPAKPDYADQTALGFASDDLDTLHARLTQQGLAPSAIQSNPWGRSFILRDPDNRRVEITQT